MKTAYTLLILLMITPAYSSEFDEEFAVYSSNGSVETVAKKLEGAIKNRKLNIFQVIDHGANAEKA
ncbi:MAG: hypothetical protein OEX00_09535, partial [Gammaproteobacteria bacterium]|nr:hypothetical protein [Gammaproteobacteria bacterium]